MTASRNGHLLSGLCLAVVLAGVSWPHPAQAQQVLICRNLHNDLANFDRRASRLGTGGARTMGTSPAAVGELLATPAEVSCAANPATCHVGSAPGQAAILDAQWQNDPVRLRLIERMRYYHCEPIEIYARGPFDTDAVGVAEVDTMVRARY